ncbi:MAG: glycosyl transferase [Candidatus Hydrogenedentota bacterium]
MRRIRVAHVITRLCMGGAQENTFHTVRLADRGRYEMELIAGHVADEEGSIEDQVRSAGIEVLRVPDLVRDPSPLRDWRAYRALVRLFRSRQYDIVHTHTSKAGYLGRMAAAQAGVPIVVHTPHGHIFFGYFNAPLTAFFTLLERHAARKTDRLVALTRRGIEEHLARRVGRREQWVDIFSGIDLAPFEGAIARRAQTRASLGLAPHDPVVGAVGRLEPVKGFTYFVEAARIIHRIAPSARFILAGDGSQRAALSAQAVELGGRFQFLGRRNDVPDLMAAMDICVAPSVNEGMGRVVLEAAGGGVPVVASEVGGIPEVVCDGVTGLLVRPRDATAIAAAVLALLDDAALRERMGRAAREFVRRYSVERMVARIEGLYDSLFKEKRLDP